MRKYLLLGLLCSLSASGQAADTVFMVKAQNDIKQLMKDPDSTKFRNVREITNTLGNKVLCGQINSKNSYGGYVGFMDFSYSNEGLNIIDMNSRNTFTVMASVDRYEKDGCEGERYERLARNPEVYKDYCAAFYQVFTDVIADNQPREIAFESAMKKYRTQNFNLIIPNENAMKVALDTNLKQMEENPATVKMLKKKRDRDFKQYLSGCAAMTKQAIEQEDKKTN
ncbi:hypothetical protein ACG9XL_17355 [Acinetobacter nosocomialis]|uniref:hypothetical protein n=1 Tax=Acinetobacter calcoaceticus/baumannii complex TaxID=909768 RepID=UPI00233F6435|nr:hypothetical protein [Acinetobacter baumannii]MDC5568458.1 hypothetical protein [Acinetobacter baumannii]MDK2172905.1 hypothetical protein [Acinetobacter baumannii]MDK2183727.1 hypothetical protein [Acinetobacter baumannii]MDK2329551.1 hypothetical protein [Acinetobacter baumannii]